MNERWICEELLCEKVYKRWMDAEYGWTMNIVDEDEKDNFIAGWLCINMCWNLKEYRKEKYGWIWKL